MSAAWITGATTDPSIARETFCNPFIEKIFKNKNFTKFDEAAKLSKGSNNAYNRGE
jgi:hypothetical protein